MLLAGQVCGGVAHGLRGTLMKRTVCDESGQLVTASLMNYSLPRADNVLAFNFKNAMSRPRPPFGAQGRARGGGDRLATSHNKRGRGAHRVEHIHMARDPVCRI